MDSKFSALALTVSLALNAQAEFTFYVGNVSIPDHDPNGYQNSATIADVLGTISDVNVTLNVTGGYNGDLYVWLSHGSSLSVLLNRVGVSSTNSVGYADTGFISEIEQDRFTLDDQAAGDLHFYKTVSYTLNTSHQLTDVWQPDGRIIDPTSSPGLFDTAPRSNKLNIFNGLDPNGQWTIFVADLSGGGVSTLTSWGLQIAVVPEPNALSLSVLGLTVIARQLWRRFAPKGHAPCNDFRKLADEAAEMFLR